MGVSNGDGSGVRFGRGWRGYNVAEVDSYRDRSVAALRSLESQLEDCRRKAEESAARLAELSEAEEGVIHAFVAAARTKKEMLEEADAEAAQIRDDAVAAAAEIRRDATDRAARVHRQAQAVVEAVLEETEEHVAETRALMEAEEERLTTGLGQLQTAIEYLETQLRRALSVEAHPAAAPTQIQPQTPDAPYPDRSSEDMAGATFETVRDRTESAVDDLQEQRRAVEQRLSRMRTAVRDLESRLRRLAESALGDLSTLGDLIDLEVMGVEEATTRTPDEPRDPDLRARPSVPPRDPGTSDGV